MRRRRQWRREQRRPAGSRRSDLVMTNCCNTEGSVAVLLNETSYTTQTALTSSSNPSQVNQTGTEHQRVQKQSESSRHTNGSPRTKLGTVFGTVYRRKHSTNTEALRLSH